MNKNQAELPLPEATNHFASSETVECSQTFASELIPTAEDAPTDVTITLAPLLTLGNLDSLHAQLLTHVEQPLRLSGAQVERIDTAVLQLLLAFIRSTGDKVTWLAPSPKLCTAAHLLGLSTYLNLPAVKIKSR